MLTSEQTNMLFFRTSRLLRSLCTIMKDSGRSNTAPEQDNECVLLFLPFRGKLFQILPDDGYREESSCQIKSHIANARSCEDGVCLKYCICCSICDQSYVERGKLPLFLRDPACPSWVCQEGKLLTTLHLSHFSGLGFQ